MCTGDQRGKQGQQVRLCVKVVKVDCTPFSLWSRVFAPRFGIPEDPVTGSAHCGLGPYFRDKLSKTQLTARQASARGGDLEIAFDQDKHRVFLRGKGFRVTTGKLLIPLD